MLQVKTYIIEPFESKCVQDKSFKKKRKGSPGSMLRRMYGGAVWRHALRLCFFSIKGYFAGEEAKVKGREADARVKSEVKRRKVLENKETRSGGQKKAYGGEEGLCQSGWSKEG